MAITSVGYDGQVNEAEWADLIAHAGGSMYGVASYADWRPTKVSDLGLRVAAGKGWGWGVLDTSDANVTVTLTTTAGSRWDLIVAHRDWDTNTTTFTKIEGTSTKAIPGRATVPGDVDDQPIALVRVAGGAIAEVIDLRIFAGDGGAYARDTLVLQFMDRVGSTIRIGDRLWTRTVNSGGSPVWVRYDVQADTGWVEAGQNGGWTFNFCQVRRIGGTIYYRISAVRPVGWSPGNQLSIIPVGFRPDTNWYSGNMHSAGSNGKDFAFYPDGNVIATHLSAGATGVTLCGSYPAPITD